MYVYIFSFIEFLCCPKKLIIKALPRKHKILFIFPGTRTLKQTQHTGLFVEYITPFKYPTAKIGVKELKIFSCYFLLLLIIL